MESFVKIENLVYEYVSSEKIKKAVNDVSLNIKKGDFIAILGHNGSGKSTLAKHLNAIFIPSYGNVYINNLNTRQEENIIKIRSKCGMIFQNPDNQIVATRVEDDVAFGPENLGIPSDKIQERVDKALKIVRMSAFKDKAPHLLSGGQKQKVAIAGILAMKPDIIVLDEATSMLDPQGRKEVMDTIIRLNKEENVTVIHITHFMQETVNADYIYVMEEGKIVLQGTPREVFVEVEKLKSIGLTSPLMTTLAYELRKKNINIKADILNVDEMVEELCRLK